MATPLDISYLYELEKKVVFARESELLIMHGGYHLEHELVDV